MAGIIHRKPGLILPGSPEWNNPHLCDFVGFNDFFLTGGPGMRGTLRFDQYFNGTPGSYTWTVPEGVTEVDVFIQGPGGYGCGGGNYTCGGPGGGGGFAWRLRYPVTPGASIPYVVGSPAWPGGVWQYTQSTTFNTELVAQGGQSGSNNGENLTTNGGSYSGPVTGGFTGGKGGRNPNWDMDVGGGGGAASYGGNGTNGANNGGGYRDGGGGGGGALISIALNGSGTYTIANTAPGQGAPALGGGTGGGLGTNGTWNPGVTYPGYSVGGTGGNYGGGGGAGSLITAGAPGGGGYVLIVY